MLAERDSGRDESYWKLGLMDIVTEKKNGALIAKAAGRVDGANARDFEAAVQSAISECDGPVIIDCEGLSYISSAGLRAILLIAKTLGKRQVKFALCSLSEPIAEIFQISGFDQIISTHSSQAEALAAVSG